MKKAILIITIVLSILEGCLVVAYVSNQIDIKKYNSGNYTNNIFAVFGFMQPYVDDYNMGNKCYMQNDYEQAIDYYNKALRKNPPHSHYNDSGYNKQCSIRINIVLAMIAQIDMDELSKEDIPSALQIIDEAKDILTEKDCAKSDGDGHSEQATQLYKELCEIEDELKQKQQEADDSDDNKKDNKQDDNDKKDEQSDESKSKVDEIMNNQSDGTAERNKNLNEVQELFDEESTYYDGESW